MRFFKMPEDFNEYYDEEDDGMDNGEMKFIVQVRDLPLPESVWVEENRDDGAIYQPEPCVSEFTCECGYKTTYGEAILRHLAENHNIKDVEEEVEFMVLVYARDELPKDAKIVPYEEYEQKILWEYRPPYIS